MAFKSYLVFNLESQSYQTRSGETVNKKYIHYLDPNTVLDNRFEMGCMPLQKDILQFSSVDASIFETYTLPAYYDLQFRGISQRVGREIKPTSKLVSADYKKSFTLPSCSLSDDAYFIFYVKFFNVNIDGKSFIGQKIFFLDPTQFTDSGYSLISVSATGVNSVPKSSFVRVPGYYSFDFSDVRGAGGDAVIKINNLEFFEEVNLSLNSSFSYASS